MRGLPVLQIFAFSATIANPFLENSDQDNKKASKECNLGKALMKHCIRIRASNKRQKNLAKLKKHVSKIDALRLAFSSEKVDRWSAVDLELIDAVDVVSDGGPYEVSLKNDQARCSSIRLRWWHSHCHDCLEDGQLVEK
ncbi:Oidioi.mRNA.OKI2018_I69.chr1.g2369.t1.cds [Oikopleura dioica]|uniref:Oidioi.mRNA.OKI2018_I69.chr1.g2369.t1.cds n=1 Tax=Oikopleura dioica TaxID=34765 RepID=A0ABN7SQW3_OIKDI|nr:Oidioi.mRNA.OKI2018_I69.chr1.g2369.t1.cds [Oikopleura dioica]